MRRFCWVILLGLFATAASEALAVSNTLTIREAAGKTTANYPVQIGRPFVPGEIADFPQAVVNGTPVETQADIKLRWPDGSVKHAILSFYLPTLQAGGSAIVTFRNQSTGNNDGYLVPSAMLQPELDFDAEMVLQNGSTLTASARSMVSAGALEYWAKGKVATSVILADHSLARRFDIGFDSHRSFRPIFQATFWPKVGKVRVRFIGEIANSEVLQDQAYALTLRLGESSPQTVYTHSLFTHNARTRWTKVFWLGGLPPRVATDHNLAYIAATTFIPNYDPTKRIPETTISADYGGWQNAPKDLYDHGNWDMNMPDPGGRGDIGPLPTWTVKWLYTGDHRLEEQALINADLAGAWPVHYREGRSGKTLDRAGNVDGVGHVLAVSSRPTVYVGDFSKSGTSSEDRIVPVGTMSSGGWTPDFAHQPDPYSAQYALTGDYWYLEQLYFWAGWGVSGADGTATSSWYGRGPTGAEGSIGSQVRSQAWVLRTRVHAAFLAPASHPEKAYFTRMVHDAIAAWEGAYEITSTPNYGTTLWQWANRYRKPSTGVPPLGHWSPGSEAFVQATIDPGTTKWATSTWEQNFMMFALGRARELGFPAQALVKYLGFNIVGQVTAAGYDPYLIGSYRIPTLKQDGTYFASFPELKTGYVDHDAQKIFKDYLHATEHGYSLIGIPAVAAAAGEPGGAEAWEFMAREALTEPALNENPKWAILPRGELGKTVSDNVAPSAPTGFRVVTTTVSDGSGSGDPAPDPEPDPPPDGDPPVPSPGPGAETLDALQPGQWFEVADSLLKSVLPDPLPPGSTGPSSIMSAWSGGAFDTARDRLVVWGGGHTDYAGNELYAFDVNLLQWKRLTEPSRDVGGDETTGYYPDGRPRSRHTYGYVVYVPPPFDRFCSVGGAGMYPSGQIGTWNFDCFNASTLTWEQKARVPNSWAGIGAFSGYDPVTGRIWAHGGGPSQRLVSYDPATNQWASHVADPTGWTRYSYSGAVHPKQRLFVSVGGGDVRAWNLDRPGDPPVYLTTSGSNAIVGRANPGLDYDPVTNRLVAWSGGADVYSLDLATRVWTLHQWTGGPAPGPANSQGTYGRFRYVPSKNVFVAVSQINTNVFFYKLSADP